jgi:type III pantothenate kinase
MTHLIGDIGNTKTKLCILDKKLKIIKKLNINTLKIKNRYYFKKIIFSFVKNKIINKKALISSVVPSVFFVIKKNFKKYFNIQCQELKQTHYSKIIKIKAKKKQIGSDRIANAIGSYYTYKSDCIVLDFGTATTFDVINRGTYLGGIIAPGVNLSLSTLIKRADLIPPFTIKKINKVVGNNTLSALRSGFYWGYAGMIENILRLIKKETKRSYTIILTGGYSSLFKNSIKSKVFIDEDITMKGLIELLRVK